MGKLIFLQINCDHAYTMADDFSITLEFFRVIRSLAVP